MQQVILIAGGTGFVGGHVASLLQAKGHRVILSSQEKRAVPTYADVIINLVGIIRENGQTYEEAHIEHTKWLLRMGKKLKVKQFVQMSAIGASPNGTRYQRTKASAERQVQESGLPYVIVRPSMIFGPEDASINRFRRIARTGFFPVLGDGTVQPVHADTVAQVIAAAVERRIRNRTVEVAGPEVFTYAQLADRIHPGVRTFNIPRILTGIITFFGQWVTSLPTDEQVVMLGQHNVTQDRTIERLGIANPRLK